MKQGIKPILSGLLLAAGSSERLGQPKQLVQFQGESLLRRTAGILLAQTDEVVVVSGAFSAEIEDELKDLPVHIQNNEAWRSGMGGSIACGMSMIGDESNGVLIMLCDQWRIGQPDLQDLVDIWKENPSVTVVARWKHSHGSPAIFPRHLFDDLQQLSGDQGAKHLIVKQLIVRFADMPNAQFDMDTEKDLQTMQSWSNRYIHTSA